MWCLGPCECCARLSGHGSRVGHNCSHLRSSSLHTLSGQLYHTCTNEHMRACWAVPPPALACSAAHAAMLGEPANREMADVSMVCSRSGSQRAMMISRGAAMRMHEWRITQGLRSHVSCVHEVTHLRRELVLGRRVVLGDVRLHVPTDRPTAMEDG